APIISSLNVATSPTGAVITWDTATENATGYVEYATTSVTSTFESVYKQVGRSELAQNHSVTLEGLVSNVTYYFRLRSTDAANNTATTTLDSFQTVLQPLTITNVATSTVTSDSAVITWSTGQAADSVVVYDIIPSTYGQSKTNLAPTSEHTIILTGLASSTTYYFRAVSSDVMGQTATSSEYSFTTTASIDPADYQAKLDQINDLLAQLAAATSSQGATAAQISALQSQVASLQQQLASAEKPSGGGVLVVDKTDKVAPKISAIRTSEIKSDSAKISWTTDEPASSFIRYGTSTAYGEFSGYSDQFTSHFFQLKNLEPNSSYHYRIESADSSGNLATSQDQIFQTPSLEEQLQAEGKTEEEIAKLVEEAQAPEENKTNILLAAAQKAMEIMSQVANQVSLGTLETTLLSQFDTIEKLAGSLPAPVLGGEPNVVAGATSATIRWLTNKEASSLVAYVPAASYLKDVGDQSYIQTVGQANDLSKTHEVKLFGLKPNTTYHYQLRSKAAVGPEARSRDFTFSTSDEALEIINTAIQNISDQKAVFKWATNQETDAKLTYAPYRNGKINIEELKEVTDDHRSTTHELAATDLEGGVIYQITMKSRNAKGNEVSDTIEQFSTTKDNLPPQITNVQTESALSQGKQLKVQTIVSWQTNEPTVGYVSYIKGVVTDDREFPDKTQLEATYSRKHVAVVTKFDSGQVYTFRIAATDSSGNTVTSKIYTILTPKQKESVFQLILKNFEDIFGWVGQVGN
ncbi:hypothetical protein HGA34_01705, partial [Candidatus Falkowbacteria bacterium]|nr:hypothetical protein [Candidatus Falkowbacteria bacterium]